MLNNVSDRGDGGGGGMSHQHVNASVKILISMLEHLLNLSCVCISLCISELYC